MSRVLAAVLGETSCPRQRLCSIRRILPSKSTCFHFRPSTSPNLVPVRATQSKNARRPSALRSECSATEQQTKWRAMGRSPQCEGRRTQARYAAPGQSHSFFLWTALHLCAASKVSTKHPRKLLGSGLSLQASAKMPRGFVLLRRHGRPSYRTVRTTSRLLWKKNEAVSQTQYGKWRTRSQPKVLAELLWDGELSLLADLGSCQVFESCLSARHESLLVGMSYHCPHRPGNTPILFI